MPVSSEARQAVIAASGGYCELFHDTPVKGTMIVHTWHQGMGGAPEDAECNDPNKLIWGCQPCHDSADGRSKHAPLVIARFDRSERLLDIMDIERRPIPHEQIFFHQWPIWKAAIAEYPQLIDAVRRENEASFDVAKHLAPFKPTKKGPELFRVCQEIKEFGHKADFWTFVSLLGMTSAKAKDRIPIGDWLNETGMKSVRGVDIDAIDALRRVPEDEVERLMGLTARLPEFWAAIEELSADKHGRRSHYLAHNPETGELEDLGLLAVEPDVAEAFALIKGRIVKGGKEE